MSVRPLEVPLEEDKHEGFEKKYVGSVYEKISKHFSDTRRSPWPVVKSYMRGSFLEYQFNIHAYGEFLSSLKTGSVGLDVGCGNFRNNINRNVFMSGCDNCLSLLKQRPVNSEAVLGNALKIPYRSNSQDFVLSIAVIHHFCSDERRRLAIKEILRVLKSDGTALIFVWAYEQKGKRAPAQKDSSVTWIVEKYKSTTGEKEAHERFYHFFNEGELENLIRNFNNVIIEKCGYDSDNWWAIIRKIDQL